MQEDRTRLRVLHVYPKDDFFTGAAVQFWDLVRGLQSRGHDVVVATRPSGLWSSKAAAAHVVHYGLPMTWELDVRSVRGLVSVLRRHRGVSFPLGRFHRLGYTTRRVTAIIAVCEAIKARLVRSGVPEAKIHVIYSGTDTEQFHPGVDRGRIRRELGLINGEFLVTQVGVRSWKGNDDLMAAMVTVTAVAPHAHLLIVGARRPESLYQRASELGLEKNLHVLGYREDVPEILAGSDCCVDASYRGLGLTGTLRESLAVATPVIATAMEGNPELVIDGETGLLVPSRDVPATAQAITKVLCDPVAAKCRAEAGRRVVELRFSMKTKVERVERLYQELLTSSGQLSANSK
jgi:glycosyltransferase involved in cell wall biosynthesis